MVPLLSIVGAVSIFYFAFKVLASILKGTRAFIIPVLRDEKNWTRRYGTWAVVTGATDGIGKAYATQLAEKGLNLILISRSREKLLATAEVIESQYGVQIKIHVADFTGGVEIYGEIEERLRGTDIGVLVNNVGMNQTVQRFVDCDKDECWKLLNVNCLSVLMMTKTVLPGMLSRRKGVVINIGSAAGEFPVPHVQIYSSTKAFMNFFSSCLKAECAGTGVDIQCVIPYVVFTKMTAALNLGKPNIMFPGPDDYVRQALRTVGVCSQTEGYLPHSLQAYIIGCLPTWFVERYIMTLGALSFIRRR